MATNTICQVADAMAQELNDPSMAWAGQFNAVRAWQPILDIKDMPTGVLFVSVVPDSMPVDEILTRGLEHQEHVVYIIVQAKVATRENAELDPLADLLEALKGYFFGTDANGNTVRRTLAFMPSAKATAASVETYLWRPHLEEMSVYTGVAAMTIEVNA